MTELVLLCSLGFSLLLLQVVLLTRLQQLEQGLASLIALQLDPDLASMIASKVSVQTAVLDPLTGRSAVQESTQEELPLSVQAEIDRFVLEQILEEEDD